MSRVTDTTSPASTENNDRGGLNLTGRVEESNRLNGSDGDDLIFAALPELAASSVTNDVIDGCEGDDIIVGFGGNDSLLGGEGNDLIFGNQGDDTLLGNSGGDVLLAGIGSDRVEAGAGDDIVSGDVDNDTLLGEAGNDIVYGGQGADEIDGGDGGDVLFGGQDSDSIRGGAGNDWIAGDQGADCLSGGVGSDTFSFNGYGNPENTVEEIGGDTITDFTTGEDKIALDRTVFSAIGDTLEAVEFLKTDNVAGASSAELIKLIYNPETGELIYNPTSAANDEVVVATLEGNPDLNLGDFEIL